LREYDIAFAIAITSKEEAEAMQGRGDKEGEYKANTSISHHITHLAAISGC
jgi:hypothetical protein